MEDTSENIYQALPLAEKRVLWYASCFEGDFEEKLLTDLFALEVERTRAVLVAAVGSGILERKPGGKKPYCFPNPALRTLVHASMNALERADAHFRIANHLLKVKPNDLSPKRARNALSHFDQARDHLQTIGEKRRFFELSLKVAGECRKGGEWEELKYILESAEKVAPTAKKDFSELWVQSQKLHYESLSMLGKRKPAEKIFASVLAEASGAADQAGLHLHKAQVQKALGEPDMALKTCRLGLGLLGLDFPESGDRALLQKTWTKVDTLVQKRFPAGPDGNRNRSMPALDPLQTPVIGELLLLAMRILLVTDPVLAAILGLQSMQHLLKHGMHGHGFLGFLSYAVGLPIWGREPLANGILRAGEMIHLGCDLSQKLMPQVAEIHFARGLAFSFVGNLRDGFPHFQKASEALAEQGRIAESLEPLIVQALHKLHAGWPLGPVEDELAGYQVTAESQGASRMASSLGLLRDRVRLLRGIPALDPERDTNVVAIFRSFQNVLEIQRSFVFEREATLSRQLDQGQNLNGFVSALFSSFEYQFWASMASGGEVPKNRSWWSASSRSFIGGLMAKGSTDIWDALATANPANFACRRELVMAIRATAREQMTEALGHYQKARSTVGESLFLAALAHELPGAMLMEAGKEPEALPLLRDACRLYAEWGCPGKVQLLQARYPELQGSAGHSKSFVSSRVASAPGQEASLSSVASLVHASEVFFRAGSLNELHSLIFQVFFQHLPASQGFLVAMEGEAFRMESWAKAGATVPSQFPLPEQKFPVSVLEKVAKAGTGLLFDRPSQSKSHRDDPYFSAHDPASLLCLPIDLGSEMRHFLCFESEEKAFSGNDMALCEILAGQAGLAASTLSRLKQLRASVDHRTDELEETLEFLRNARDQLVQSEKLASLGQVTAGIAHEIRNPLNFVNNFSELSIEMARELREELEEMQGKVLAEKDLEVVEEYLADLEGNLEKIQNHGKRAESIVHNMLMHAASGKEETREVELNRLIREYALLAYHGFRGRLSAFVCRLDFDLDERVGSGLMQQQDISRALLNIFQNAFQAMEEKTHQVGEEYKPRIEVQTLLKGEKVEIRIRDNGPGIPDEVRARVFEPFFTTKASGKGTGLGLSLAYELVVQGHGGELEVESSPGAYTEFLITLPWKK